MTREQKYKRSYARVLVRIAEEDFTTLEILFQAKGGRKENVCFIAQQVVEKCIKALLVQEGIGVPFTHNIELLLSKLPAANQPPRAAALEALTEYATIRRYEEGYAELDSSDLLAAFQTAQDILKFARAKVGTE